MEDQLCSACENGDVSLVQQLLQSNPQINVNYQNNDGEIPFYIVCYKGYIDIVKVLLNDERVNVNKPNAGWTPFYSACYKGHIDIVKLLLNDNRVDINKANNDGSTPFYSACDNGRIEIVKLLFDVLNDQFYKS